MAKDKDKYNIGLDILDERIIAGNTCVTVNLFELLKLEQQYKVAMKERERKDEIIHNLVNSSRFLLASIDTRA